jgi:hypothetical protein
VGELKVSSLSNDDHELWVLLDLSALYSELPLGMKKIYSFLFAATICQHWEA